MNVSYLWEPDVDDDQVIVLDNLGASRVIHTGARIAHIEFAQEAQGDA